MIFSSIRFLFVFLPVFCMVYYITPSKWRNVILFVGSIVFYACGEPRYVFLLLASLVLNYGVARLLEKQGKIKKFAFAVGILLNIGLLVIFKVLPDSLGLPLGISFYTFQSLSYLIDVYRGEIQSQHSFICMGSYICMFPQLVAGPIVMYQEIEKDIKQPQVTMELVDAGLKDFTVGLAMKLLLADRLSIFWNELSTAGYESLSVSLAWMGAISYSLQIYFDFFGYSMMAIGLGKMLGFHIPRNFDHPYQAASIREFYRRWHITLGRWFAKYIYIPLGGSRGTKLQTVFNLFVVWILTALWHGVGMNFLLWGMMLCVVIMLEKLFPIAKKGVLISTLQHGYVLFFIVISWVCFAITDVHQLMVYLGRMFGLLDGTYANLTVFYAACSKYGLTILIGLVIALLPVKKLYEKGKNSWIGMICLTILFWVSVWYVVVMGNNPFLYFRF